MPAGKQQQSSAIFYTLVAFVGLFIVAATLAVIYYLKFEEQRQKANEKARDLAEMISDEDWLNRGKIIGDKNPKETYAGNMVAYLDKTVSLIMGPSGSLKDISAEVKVENAEKKARDVLKLAGEQITENLDPNINGLVPTIEKLQAALSNAESSQATLKEQLNERQKRFDVAMTETRDKEKQLEDEKEQYHQKVTDITQEYEELKILLEKTSGERIKILSDQLEQERADHRKTKDDLMNAQVNLNMAQDEMKRAIEALQQIKPSPDQEIAAYQPDGKVILVDEQTGVVHLNIGTDDHVYPGLTFSIYDRNAPIPKSGVGKAEVEVFDLKKNTSSARIIPSMSFEERLNEVQAEFTDIKDISSIMLTLAKPYKERIQDFKDLAGSSDKRLRILNNLSAAYEQRGSKKRPVAEGDIAANLIWDSNKKNIFVAAGEFDLDGDGIKDRNAIEKIKARIEEWGGIMADTISVETDFLVLGSPPQVPPMPNSEDLEKDPTAERRYKDALKKFNDYQEIQSRAQVLWIPVFTYDRFLYFIGCKEKIIK